MEKERLGKIQCRSVPCCLVSYEYSTQSEGGDDSSTTYIVMFLQPDGDRFSKNGFYIVPSTVHMNSVKGLF